MLNLKSGEFTMTGSGKTVLYMGAAACWEVDPKYMFGETATANPEDAVIGDLVGWVHCFPNPNGEYEFGVKEKEVLYIDDVLCQVDYYNARPDRKVAPIYRLDEYLKWTVEIEVSRQWVEDGFDLDQERVTEMVEDLIHFAYPGEIRAKVVSAPDAGRIRRIQGHKD